jgi:hypothetical protein
MTYTMRGRLLRVYNSFIPIGRLIDADLRTQPICSGAPNNRAAAVAMPWSIHVLKRGQSRSKFL